MMIVGVRTSELGQQIDIWNPYIISKYIYM